MLPMHKLYHNTVVSQLSTWKKAKYVPQIVKLQCFPITFITPDDSMSKIFACLHILVNSSRMIMKLLKKTIMSFIIRGCSIITYLVLSDIRSLGTFFFSF